MNVSRFALAILAMMVSMGAHRANAQQPAATRKILFLAGPRDHEIPGRHEYERDLRTLAQSLEQSGNLHGVTTQLIVGRLPRDLEGRLRGVRAAGDFAKVVRRRA
jgi:hypothetical protein